MSRRRVHVCVALNESQLSVPRFSTVFSREKLQLSKRKHQRRERSFPPPVCVHLGVAVLLLASANWSECTKNSPFLGNLSTLSGKMNVLQIRGCHLQPVTRKPAWVMHARASERVPSLTPLNLTVLIRWWSVIQRAACLLCITTQRRQHNNLFGPHVSRCCQRRSRGDEERFHMDPPSSPGARWQQIVLYVFMSGQLFSFSFENKDKLYAGFYQGGELRMNLHFLLSRPHLHLRSFSVVPLLPKGNWTVYFCVYFKSVGVVIKFPMTPFPQLHTLKWKALFFFFLSCLASLSLARQ